MPDWKKEIRERLAGLRLAPTREAEIVEELAQYLEDCYEELLASGTTKEDAWRTTLEELNESDLLARELNKIERPVSQEPVVLGARRINMLSGSVARLALRDTNAAQEQRLHDGRRAFTGAGHRREHGVIQCGGCRAAEDLAGR